MKRALSVAILALLVFPGVEAAQRRWQQGTWVEVRITRPKIVIGVRPKPRPGEAPRMTEIRTYVIATDDLRLEVKELSPPPLRLIDAIVGEPVTLALEKKTVYILKDDGSEHRLQLVKKEERRRPSRERRDRAN
jgi:hypothetical protein